MKHVLLLFLLTCTVSIAKSQDVIITAKGDTISCKITRISDQYIHYTISEQSLRSRIPVEQVLSYSRKKEVVAKPEEETEIVEEEPFSQIDNLKDFSSLRLALNAGFTYQFGGYEGLPASYTKQVQSLLNLGTEMHYFPSDRFGIGIKFNRISTGAEEENLGTIGRIEENIRFNYLALSILSRQLSIYDNSTLYYGISVGLISYRDTGTIDGSLFTEEGETIGLSFEVGYDIPLNSSLGVGLNLGVNLANLNNLTVNGISIPNADFSLSRVDFTAGLRLFK